MPKSGMFAAEVTQSAPAGGAATTKGKAFQWMQYGVGVVDALCSLKTDLISWWPLDAVGAVADRLDAHLGGGFINDLEPVFVVTDITGLVNNALSVGIGRYANWGYVFRNAAHGLGGGKRNWSYATWVKPSRVTGSDQTLASASNGALVANKDYVLDLVLDVPTLRIAENPSLISVSGTAININVWSLVAVGYDLAQEKGWISVNGGARAYSATITTPNDTNPTFNISATTNAGPYSDCDFDESAFWSKRLSDADITALYNSGNGLSYTDLVCPPTPPAQNRVINWWEFEEPSDASNPNDLFDEVEAAEFDPQNAYVSVLGVRGQAARVQESTSENMTGVAGSQYDIDDNVWSCSFWWQTPSSLAGQEDRYLACLWKENSPSSGSRKWRFVNNAAANGFIFSIGQGPDPTTFTNIDTGDISLTTDSWYHMVATHDPVADEMTFTVSKRGFGVGTRLTAAIVGGAYPGVPPISPQVTLGRATAGALKSDGYLDMFAFWDDTIILSEDDVMALFTDELKYDELAPDPPSELLTDLASWWSLDEVSGTRADSHDSNTLTDNNTVLSAAGKVSNAALFVRAIPEWLSIASNSTVQMGDIDFTIACWYYTTSSGAIAQFPMAKESAVSGEREYLFAENTDVLQFSVFRPTDTEVALIDTNVSPISTSTWYFLVGWHDAAADMMYFQVNNGPIDSQATGGSLQVASDADFTLGCIRANAAFGVDGRVDEAAVWKRILTAGERTELYNSGNGIGYPGP
jgi:hypothetical protein